MGDPQVAGFNSKSWSSMTWMIWGDLHFREPQIDRRDERNHLNLSNLKGMKQSWDGIEND